jgi:hypothetical protein
MWEKEDKAEDARSVKDGFATWRDSRKSRPLGQDPRGPESAEEAALSDAQKAIRSDRQSYFASSIMADYPSAALSPKDNWYGNLIGEWDVAWITDRGTGNEAVVNGEWNFAWINDGEAIEDSLAVPYRWEAKNHENPINYTAVRAFDPDKGYWDGFLLKRRKLLPFRSSRDPAGNIYETYPEGENNFEVWVFSSLSLNAFQVSISHTSDNGVNYRPIAEIWAKRRTIDLDE